jgi:hypothetical protein
VAEEPLEAPSVSGTHNDVGVTVESVCARAACPHHLGRRITDEAAQPSRGAACVGTERGTTAERTAIALAERGS